VTRDGHRVILVENPLKNSKTEENAMAVRPTVPDVEALGKDLLLASSDLLAATVKAYAEKVMA
jgi:hypothetical protein